MSEIEDAVQNCTMGKLLDLTTYQQNWSIWIMGGNIMLLVHSTRFATQSGEVVSSKVKVP